MSVLAPVYFLFPGLAFRRLAPHHVRQFATPEQTKRIVADGRRRHRRDARERDRHSGGVNLLLRHLEWDRALYESAISEGLSSEDAGAVIAAIKWDVFGPLNALAFRASRIRSRSIKTRVAWLLDVMFKTMFTKPFRREKRGRDGLAFDVTMCPIAQYCQNHGVADLARHAACDLDYRMAQTWGVDLRRTQTLAAGGSCCDFRFHTRNKEDRE